MCSSRNVFWNVAEHMCFHMHVCICMCVCWFVRVCVQASKCPLTFSDIVFFSHSHHLTREKKKLICATFKFCTFNAFEAESVKTRDKQTEING